MADRKPIHLRKRFNDLTGKTFGRWQVVSYAGPVCYKRQNHASWLCRCQCGTERVVVSSSLTGGYSKSCGCLTVDSLVARRIVHGLSHTKEYKIWQMMIDRCTNPKSAKYEYYGARGIGVCERWRHSFENFLADMGHRPTNEHSLDRFPDQNGNYEPSNVRWATLSEQRNNQRNNHLIEFNGKSQTMAAWERELGLPKGILKDRINRYKWTIERALTTPSPCRPN